jgi:glycosyltransferase involved in cell wall biosynthesis
MPSSKNAEENQPLVSIIVPTYNYSRFLPDAVESALGQTYSNIEVIVVDDGSTDETASLVETQFSGRVRYLFQSNQGLSSARNTGIREARGPFLTFLDADDQLCPSMVEESVAAMLALGEAFGIVANQAGFVDENGKELPLRNAFPEANIEIRQIDLIVMNRFGANLLARRDAIVNAGCFDVTLRACEDRDMWIRVAENHRIMRLGKRLSLNRLHGSNMSSDGVQQTAGIRRVLAKAKRNQCLTGWKRIFWAKVWSMYFYQSGLLFIKRNQIRAIVNLLLSCVLWPWFADRLALGQTSPVFRLRTIAWILSGRWKRG